METVTDTNLTLPLAPPADSQPTLPATLLDAPVETVRGAEMPETLRPSNIPTIRAAAISTHAEAVWRTIIPADATPGMTLKTQKSPPVSRSRTSLTISVKTRVLQAGTPDDRVADYQLLERLGEGGMGVVHAARQTAIDRTIAIKRIKPNLAADAEVREKFLREAVVTGELDHPNIVPIYDLGSDETGVPFYVMKWIRGSTWRDKIKTQTKRENIEVLLRVCDAVAFAHSHRVIHRDLKPDNIMLGEFGEVLVVDWGLATYIGEDGKVEFTSEQDLFGGTPGYMAPEMATSDPERLNYGSDIYLLGAMLFEILEGAPPHPGETAFNAVRSAATNEIRPAASSGELMDIARKAMETEPSKRHASVKEFQAAIRAYLSHEESSLLAERAAEHLAEAIQTRSYNDFARSVFGNEQALALWDGNYAARQGAETARLYYAECACEKGDLDLAASLLTNAERSADASATGLNAGAIRQRVQQASFDRAQRLKNLKWATRTAQGLAAAIIVILATAVFWVSAAKKKAELAEASARGELQKREALELEKQAKLDGVKREAAAAKTEGFAALKKAGASADDAAREQALIEAQTAFRKALFLIPDPDAENGMRDASLQHYDLAIKEKNWRQAAEKLEQARQVKLADADYDERKKNLAEAETARERMLKQRIDFLMADAQKAYREVPYESARNELISLRHPVTTKILLTYLNNPSAVCQQLAIESLAWMGDKSVAAAVLPYIEKQLPDGKDTPLAVQEAAIRTICLLAPEDTAIFERLRKRISSEPGGLDYSVMSQHIGREFQTYSKALGQSTAMPDEHAKNKTFQDWFKDGQLAFDLKQFDKALLAFTECTKLDPRSDDARFWVGWSKQSSGDLKGAIADYTATLQLNDKYFSAYNNRGLAKSESDDLDGAIEDYGRAIAIGQGEYSFLPYRNRAWILANRGEYAKAIADLDEALKLKPQDAISHNRRGWAWKQLKDYTRADADFSAALAIDPGDVAIYVNRGHMRIEQKRYQEAALDCQKALEIAPEMVGVQRLKVVVQAALMSTKGVGNADVDADIKGMAISSIPHLDEIVKKSGDKDAAAILAVMTAVKKQAEGDSAAGIAILDEAILKADPKNGSTLGLLVGMRGSMKLIAGNSEGALEDLNKAVGFGVKAAETFTSRGRARFNLHDYAGAISDCEEAFKLEPQDIYAFILRGDTRRELGQLDQAVEDFNAALKLGPKSADALAGRGMTYVKQSKQDLARADYDKTIELNPGFAMNYDRRGDLRQSTGDLDGALADYSAELKLTPKNEVVYCKRAIVLASKGDSAAALKDFDAAIALNPKLVQAYWGRAVLKALADEFDAALVDCEIALKTEPKNVLGRAFMGIVYACKGDWKNGAIPNFEAAFKLNPGQATALDDFIVNQFEREIHGAKLIKVYAGMVEAFPESAAALNALAWELVDIDDQKLRDVKRALPLAQKAVALSNEKKPEYLDTLSLAQFENGQTNAAIASEEKAIKLLPEKTPESEKKEYTDRLAKFREALGKVKER